MQISFVRSLIQLFTAWKLRPGVAFKFWAVHSLDQLETCYFCCLSLDQVSFPTFLLFALWTSLKLAFYPPGTWTWCRFQLLAVCSQNIFCCLETWTWTFKSTTYYFQVKYSQNHILTPPIAFLDYRTGGANLRSKRKSLIYGQCDQDIVPVCSTQNVCVTFWRDPENAAQKAPKASTHPRRKREC